MLNIEKKIGQPLIKRVSSKISLHNDVMNESCIGLNESIYTPTLSTESKKDMPIYSVFLLVNLS